MTLIVGIRCANGIVVGADGAATLGSMGTFTAQQKTVKKLSILQGRIVVGVAGAVGLGQRLRATLEQDFIDKKYKGRAELAIGVMRNSFWNVVGPEWTAVAATAKVFGPGAVSSSAHTAMLVAMPLDGKAELIQFDQQCAPELATDDLPFVAIGSGQQIADPFLALVRKIFWPKSVPNLNDGVFSIVWTLRHAIDTVPQGVADPIQVAVLEKQKGEWSARELTSGELEQHEEAVKDAERALIDWRSQFTKAPVGEAPEGPPT